MQIDNPVYTYTVNRFLNAQNCLRYPGGSNTISYDNNDNMTVHPDKGISYIKYNYLNLPEQVTQDSKITNYIYRADGVKVKKSGTAGLATDYLDGFQYTETNLFLLQKGILTLKIISIFTTTQTIWEMYD